MRKKKRLPSIQRRLLMSNIGVVLAAFFIVLLTFNVLMSNYINDTATRQLQRVISNQNSKAIFDQNSDPKLPNLINANTGDFKLPPKVFDITTNYIVQTPAGTPDIDKTTALEIATTLKSHRQDLSALKNKRLLSGGSVFYIDTVKHDATTYRLFYTDVSGIITFANRISLYLIFVAFVVLILSSLFVLFVTRSITKPLSNLADFAKRIGKGDFTRDDSTFNILEFAQLSGTLNDSAKQLDTIDKDQKTFFQNASHELRTPLMSIKSYAEGIKYDVMPAADASDVILNETDRMTELVEDLLTISRLDSLNSQTEVAVADCRELMQDVVNEQKQIAQSRNLEFVLDFDNKAVNLEMNYKAMRRAISNLSTNSLRYAKHAITMVCQNTNQGILLAVKNDGEAISPEAVEHLFERFYKGKGGVHGIGLAIVKSVVEQHGGKITVKSDDSETAFMMTFPRMMKQ